MFKNWTISLTFLITLHDIQQFALKVFSLNKDYVNFNNIFPFTVFLISVNLNKF
jgi:hypothetical protein